MAASLTFRPIKNEVVVVMRGDKVAGTIRRYRVHKACLVSVEGVLSPAANKGRCAFPTIPEAKRAILAADRARDA